ncbi:MAG: Holliday junction resolvase RuvX [Verrucomicrobiia bacterium]|jgi:putative Holliday junction resolvase
MRILGVDYGHKRIGLALSDESGTIAQPLDYIDGGAAARVSLELVRLCAERKIGKIVVGIPLRLDGTPSEQTERTLVFIAELRRVATIPVAQWDERLTSVQAARALLEGNVRRSERKQKIDKLAAQIMLQSYLDATNPPPAEA